MRKWGLFADGILLGKAQRNKRTINCDKHDLSKLFACQEETSRV